MHVRRLFLVIDDIKLFILSFIVIIGRFFFFFFFFGGGGGLLLLLLLFSAKCVWTIRAEFKIFFNKCFTCFIELLYGSKELMVIKYNDALEIFRSCKMIYLLSSLSRHWQISFKMSNVRIFKLEKNNKYLSFRLLCYRNYW